MSVELLNRIRGCLLGGAVGDALGYAVEFMDDQAIRAAYGAEGIRSPKTGPDGVACFSDDTQMTLFTCEGMILGYNKAVAGGMAADMEGYVYEAYLDWLATQGEKTRGIWHHFSYLMKQKTLFERRAPGLTCLGALRSGRMGTLAEPINNSCGCGGVMRVAPVGFVARFGRRYDDYPEDAYVWQAAKIAAITHGHPLGYMPAAMLADMIHRMTREDGTSLKDNVMASLTRTERLLGRDERDAARVLRELVEKAAALADTPEDAAIPQLGQGWTGHEALAIAIYCALRYENDFAGCLRAAVNHGGDSDSTGSIAGQILGAWKGAEVIPAEWLKALEGREIIETMAQQLEQVAVEQRM